MSKSKIQFFEEAFIRSVDTAINEVAEATYGKPGTPCVKLNDYVIELCASDRDNHTLTFYGSDHKIIAYVDYEMGVGITGYELAGVQEDMYFELAGCLLTWQCEVMHQINSK
jgi:hypothetical protein